MTTLKLTRLNEPNIEKLYEMKSTLRNILEEGDFKNLNTILDFQDKDGSFKLFSTYRIPSDARVDFCHEPTYICSSILMKAYLTGDSKLKEKIETPLIRGSERCCCRNLRGHGYEALEGQIEALNIFMKGGLREFIDLYPELNSKFTAMILNIIEKLVNDNIDMELIEKLRKMNIIEFYDNRIILDRRYSTKALVEFIKNEYNSSIESYINPKKTIEEIKGNKYNIWNCGFIKFKIDFSF